jgi:tRNA 2-thiouridine synthesizing protein C
MADEIPDDFDDDEFEGVVKKFMFVSRKAPYGTIYGHEMQETMLISAAFEQDVSVVFMDDGVFLIKKGHDTAAINVKNFSPTYRAFDGYDIEKLYVEKESMEARGLTEDDLLVPVEVISATELGDLMDQQDVIISA